MKTKAKNPLVYLWALLPVASAAVFFLMLFIDTEIWVLIRPIFKFSIVGVLAVCAGFFMTGFAGYRFAGCGVGALKAILIGNAVPIACALAYGVLVATGNGELHAAEMIGELGNGLFSLFALDITLIAQRTFSYFEVYIAFGFLIAAFVVGYSVGAAKKNNK